MYAIEANKSFVVDRLDNEVIFIMVETGITLGISRSSRLGPPTDLRCVVFLCGHFQLHKHFGCWLAQESSHHVSKCKS